VIGELVARVDSTDPNAIAWLLLRAKSTSGAGIFSGVQFVQRLHTVGGNAPSAGMQFRRGRASNQEWHTPQTIGSTSPSADAGTAITAPPVSAPFLAAQREIWSNGSTGTTYSAAALYFGADLFPPPANATGAASCRRRPSSPSVFLPRPVGAWLMASPMPIAPAENPRSLSVGDHDVRGSLLIAATREHP